MTPTRTTSRPQCPPTRWFEDWELLAATASIVHDAVWHPSLEVVAGEVPSRPDWVDVDGREATADRELRALLTETQDDALREAVEDL